MPTIMTAAQIAAARAYKMEIAEQDFLMDRADAQAEISDPLRPSTWSVRCLLQYSRTHFVLNTRFPRMMYAPFPTDRYNRMRVWELCGPDAKMILARLDVESALRELTIQETPMPMHGVSD